MKLKLALAVCLASAASAAVLGVRGEKFTIDGKPAFLLGISYYGGLASNDANLRADLDEIKAHGFNWIRVWATWRNAMAFDAAGNAMEPGFSRMVNLVKECDKRGLIVDVTFSATEATRKLSEADRFAAQGKMIASTVKALHGQRNWYLDLANERNNPGTSHVPVAPLRQWRDAAKKAHPALPITASHWNDIPLERLGEYVDEIGVDFLSPHGDRLPDAVKNRAVLTQRYLKALRERGKAMPVHYQEPSRRDFIDSKGNKWQPSGEDLIVEMENSRQGGAAGWCFHNGDNHFSPDRKPERSFDLRGERLFPQFDAEERKFLAHVKKNYGK